MHKKAKSDLLILGILNVLCFNLLQARDLTHLVLCWAQAWAYWPSWSLMTVASLEPLQHQNIGSFATFSLPPYKWGLWVTAVHHQFCAMWLLHHMSELFSQFFPSMSWKLLISHLREKKSTQTLYSYSHGEFSWLDFFRYRLWICA